MNQPINNKQTHQKLTLKQQISAEVEVGITLSADPVNANLPDLALRTTTINSVWFGQICGVCKDRFREGDLVRLCPKCGEPFHDDSQYGLRCWGIKFVAGVICKEGVVDDRFAQEGTGPQRCEFSLSPASSTDAQPSVSSFEGDLLAEKRPHSSPAFWLVKQFVGGIETTWRPFGELEPIKIPLGSPLAGRKCPWCRFTVRGGDWAVQCPCESNCGTYFHQDVFHHLTCWNNWNGVAGNDFCPNTGAEYPESAKRKKDNAE